ncbi:sensor histidine kinase [Streptomyces chumphonensis]|nr:sensor histidine kinase [Streptomyces chumphonensis]
MSTTRASRARLRVQTWLHLVLGAVLLLVVGATVAGGVLLSRSATETDDLVDRLQPARVEAYRLQKALLDQETGVRGYVVSGNEEFLEPYTSGLRDEQAALRQLRPTADADATLAADLAEIERLAAAWRREHAEPLIRSATAGADPQSAALTAELRSSKETFDRMRATWRDQNRHLEEARDAAREELERSRRTHLWLFVGVLAAFVVTGVALAVLLHYAVARPLRALRRSVQRVGDGDFAHHIPAGGPADLHEVAESVEAMRGRIVAELDAARSREELLARRTADLDHHTEELRRSNSELEQFAYVASHDLQEPLRKVASFCQLLEKRYGEQLDERGRQYVDFAVDGAKRMQVLINDLLTFSRVGRLHDARDAVPLGGALDKALANLSTAVEETGARVERPADLPRVTGDPTLLTMLWQNLVGNAIKFRHAERAPVVGITAFPPGADAAGDGAEGDEAEERGAGPGLWTYCVTDNGIGVPGEFTEKVFVIFQRLHGRDAYAGTGIGLALCRKIVEHHGGRIWIDTAHTEGTRVCFTLPADPGPSLPAPTSPDTADTTAAPDAAGATR